ncbi:cytoplasmic protein [Bacillus pseudomycoides]|uniref:Cytoplasmic protein n=1 Tax=Bacillus pseudomycoides TaxID=64104 RepID=A0AA91VE35_9BACI|nr:MULTISPECIES: PH domain-containing protein [Bacillus]PEB51766.1 cytoplasmic protein [Bacillus sp. AFS098217]PED82415.1 cytoplasmic protein [Bacillus pseudomycoides]PEU06433.1 cytoplasmic protein [Bacillus sp. AFS019443]PEU18679.1 cytoplasmic protein [Bacillus sp. AFS014408]PFW63952.1 cytoplasmic protein [Bacillus sp. AFS075034]
MGLFSGILGNASDANTDSVERDLQKIMLDDEQVEHAYKLIRDLIVFTNRRMILVDKQGVTGKKTEYHSIPYKSITQFSIETAGHFDLDAELKIWISSMEQPITKEFKSDDSILSVQKALTKYTTK